MDSLIADFPVSRVPNPMPVVVKAIPRKRLQRRRARPQIVVHPSWNGFLGSVADRRPPLVTNRARQVHVPDRTIVQVPNGFDHAGIRSRLASMLANPVVFLDRANELPSFKPVMGTWLFHVDVLLGLASPDRNQRVPMIRSSDGDSIDFFVFEQLANIDVGLGLWQPHLLDVFKALVQHAFVYITESGNLRVWNACEAADVIVAAASHSADGHPHSVVRAQDSRVARSS